MANAKPLTKARKKLLDEKPIKYTYLKEGKNYKSVDKLPTLFEDALREKEKEEEKPIKIEAKDAKNIASYAVDDSSSKTTLSFPDKQTQYETKSLYSSNAIESADDLSEKLKEIIDYYNSKTDADLIPDEYKPKVEGSLNLQKVEVPILDEDSLKEEVTKTETDKVNASKKSYEDKINQEIEKIFAEIESRESSREGLNKEINEIYDNYKLSEENEALKRGLSRSSVALLNLNGVEKERAEALSDLALSLEEDITSLEKEITSLQGELKDALSVLDLSLSENINSELKKKIDEIEKKQAEAIEFNNNVSKLEAEYQGKKLSYVDDAIALEKKLKEEYAGASERFKREEVMNTALKYFGSKGKSEALKELTTNSGLASVLGDMYYDLYYLLMRRSY